MLKEKNCQTKHNNTPTAQNCKKVGITQTANIVYNMSMATQLQQKLLTALNTINVSSPEWRQWQPYLNAARQAAGQERFTQSYVEIAKMAEKMVSTNNIDSFKNAQNLFTTYATVVGGQPNQIMDMLKATVRNREAKQQQERNVALNTGRKPGQTAETGIER